MLKKIDAGLKRLRWNSQLRSGLAILSLLAATAVLADFVAPYAPSEQDREHFFSSPTRVRFRDGEGRWQLRPFVFASHLADPGQMLYVEDESQRYPLKFFVDGEPYVLLGLLPCRVRLFGVDAPARLFLLGTDGLGRDVASRVLSGARLSLTIAFVALLVCFPLALFVGCIAGYYGGKVDFIMMRLVEVFMALPALYLVIALRSTLPLNLPTESVAIAIVAVLALFGWAGLARIVRGMVLSLRERDFVIAAEAMGATDWRIISRHILPQLIGVSLIQAAVIAPGFVLAETTLSYLGLGIQEPVASWGNMLASAQNLQTWTSYWWTLAPGGAVFLVSFAFYLVAEGLRRRADPRGSGFSQIREAF